MTNKKDEGRAGRCFKVEQKPCRRKVAVCPLVVMHNSSAQCSRLLIISSFKFIMAKQKLELHLYVCLPIGLVSKKWMEVRRMALNMLL